MHDILLSFFAVNTLGDQWHGKGEPSRTDKLELEIKRRADKSLILNRDSSIDIQFVKTALKYGKDDGLLGCPHLTSDNLPENRVFFASPFFFLVAEPTEVVNYLNRKKIKAQTVVQVKQHS